jgi:hypothetical protein
MSHSNLFQRRRPMNLALTGFAALVTVSLTAVPSHAATSSKGPWSNPIILAHSLSKQFGGSVSAVSCSAPGNCTAAGTYVLAPGGLGAPTKGFVDTETNGHWAPAQTINGEISSISCWSPGNCGAVGDDFVVNQTNGHWGAVRPISQPSGTTSITVGNISCPSSGSCLTEGTFFSGAGWNAFVLVESGGKWAQPGAINVAFTAQNTYGFSSSCSSAQNCVVGGEYVLPGGGGMNWNAFIVEEINGLWGIGHQVAGSLPGDASVDAISCTGSRTCSAAGMAGSEGYVIDQVAGRWTSGRIVPGTLASSFIRSGGAGSISCSSPGNCAVTGGWQGSSGWIAFAAGESNFHWNKARLIGSPNGGVDSLGDVSCAGTGQCVAIGQRGAGDVVLAETHGHWSAPTALPGTSGGAELNSVSCVKSGLCVIGGQLNRSGTTFAFVT